MKYRKFCLTIVLILGLFNSAKLQSIDSLDTKYGFKHFKLNTSIVKYEKEIILDVNDANTEEKKTYKYIGGKINDLFGVKIHEILLNFYKNKLSSIYIKFGKLNESFTESDYKLLLYKLTILYGNSIKLQTGIDGNFNILNANKWKGAKVELEMIRHYYIPNQLYGGYIIISELSLKRQKLSDGF